MAGFIREDAIPYISPRDGRQGAAAAEESVDLASTLTAQATGSVTFVFTVSRSRDQGQVCRRSSDPSLRFGSSSSFDGPYRNFGSLISWPCCLRAAGVHVSVRHPSDTRKGRRRAGQRDGTG